MAIKKRIKPFLYIIVAILCLTGWIIPHRSIVVEAASGSTTVYITDYGEKYHTYSCQYLHDSRYAISLSSAVQRGYTPCSKCNPPRLTSGEDNVNPRPSTPSYQGGGSTNQDDERWIPIFWAVVFAGIAVWLIVKYVREERAEKRRLLEEQEEDEQDDNNE